MRIDEIAAVRDAFARQAWKDAYAGFRTADEAGAPLEAEDLERLAVCAYMVGKDEARMPGRAHIQSGCGCGTCGALRAAPFGWCSTW